MMKLLIESPAFRPRAMARSETKAKTVFDSLGFGTPGAAYELAVADVTKPESMAAALQDVDIVISSVATPTKPLFPSQKLVEETEVEGLKSLLQAVKQAGTVKHFVLISTHKATCPDEKAYKLLNFLFSGIVYFKLIGENVLRASGVPYTVVRSGGISDTSKMPETAEDLVQIPATLRATVGKGKGKGAPPGEGQGEGASDPWTFRLRQGDCEFGSNLRIDLCKTLLATIENPQMTVSKTFEVAMVVGGSEKDWIAGCPSSVFAPLLKDTTVEVLPKRPVKPPAWYLTRLAWCCA